MDEEELDVELETSRTYRILNGRVTGWTDTIDAMRQAVEKILQTERFRYEIYSDEYGIELESLIGENFDLVVAEIERILKEALLADERIVSIDDLTCQQSDKTSVLIAFTVASVFGAFTVEQEVSA